MVDSTISWHGEDWRRNRFRDEGVRMKDRSIIILFICSWLYFHYFYAFWKCSCLANSGVGGRTSMFWIRRNDLLAHSSLDWVSHLWNFTYVIFIEVQDRSHLYEPLKKTNLMYSDKKEISGCLVWWCRIKCTKTQGNILGWCKCYKSWL